MTLQEYLTSLRHKTVAVIGIGVSNTPLLRRLLAEGIAVTACDRSSREKLGPLADELEAAGATLRLGEGYLDGLTQDVIFRTPGLRTCRSCWRRSGRVVPSPARWRCSFRSAPAT